MSDIAMSSARDALLDCRTFSIVGLDPVAGEIGIAVASRYFDVGYALPWLRTGTGAVMTQAYVNPHLGSVGIQALEDGLDAPAALSRILALDDGRERRQVGIVDFSGNAAAHTGSETDPWAGHLTAHGVAVQGNILAGPVVLQAMLDVFLAGEGPLSERLLGALEAGEAQGGDIRGKQSAALYVVRRAGGLEGVDDRLVDLKVTDHSEPIAELRRLYDLWRYAYLVRAYVRLADEAPALGIPYSGHISRILRQTLESKTTRPEMLASLARYLGSWKKYSHEMFLIAQKAHECGPNNVGFMDLMAEAKFAAGKVKEAINLTREAIRLEPDNAYLRKQLEKFVNGG